MILNVENYIRKIAKQSYWQTIYSQAREMSGINIFVNQNNFTNLQVEFLNYLSFYYSLMFDIAYGDVSDIVLDNFIYEDAYYEYKNQQRAKKNKKSKHIPEEQPKDVRNKHKQNIVLNKNEWVFTKSKG